MDKGYKTAINIPDAHVPWNCVASFKIILNIIKDVSNKYGLDELNLLGDFLDYYHVGLHPKMPSHFSIKQTFKDEIYLGNKALDKLRDTAPEADFRYIEGNHEQRLMQIGRAHV